MSAPPTRCLYCSIMRAMAPTPISLMLASICLPDGGSITPNQRATRPLSPLRVSGCWRPNGFHGARRQISHEYTHATASS